MKSAGCPVRAIYGSGMTSRGKLTVSGFLQSNKDKCISGVNSVLVLILDPNWGSELFSLTAHLTGMRNRKQKKKNPQKTTR